MRNWARFGGSTGSGFGVGLVFGFSSVGDNQMAAAVFWGSKVELYILFKISSSGHGRANTTDCTNLVAIKSGRTSPDALPVP